MTSSSRNPKAQAQIATAPDSPHQKIPSSEENIQRHIKAIHDLLADKKSGISRTRRPHSDGSIADNLEQTSMAIEAVADTRKMHPLDDGSEFLTDNQLADSIEAAWKSLSSPETDSASSSSGRERLIRLFQWLIHHRSLPIAYTSDTCSSSQASDAVTEIDDSSQLFWTGTDDRKGVYGIVNEVYVGDSIS